MDKKELLSQIKTGESQTVEFKESLGLINEIGEAVSAFSNTNNGVILIGIDDHKKIIGVEIGKKTLENLANYIKTQTDNHIFPKISIFKVENKNIIIIEISLSDEKPVFFKGTAYKRVGKSSHKLSASEIRTLAKNSGKKVYWDEQTCKGANIEDIDEEKVKWFLGRARKKRGLGISEDTSLKECLIGLKLMKEEKPTNAAILLLAKNPQTFFIQAEVKCIRFKGIDVTGPMIDFKTIEGDIINQLEKAEDFIFEHIPMAAWIENGKLQRQEKWLYPPKAIRESLANALVHRDYETTSKIQVRIFDDRMEIWNPGKLPDGWIIEKLKEKHESIPFNPSIAKQFFWIKYIEDVGSGTNKIIKWCKEWGLPEPVFEFTGSSIVVIFRKSKLTEEFLDESGLNERQKKAIEYLREHKKITSSAYSNIFKITERMARNDLKDLVDKEIIEKKGLSDKTRYYVLAEI